jgi:MFS family permease
VTGLERLTAGIAYVRGNPIILGAISLDLFAVLLGGATALLPIYARDILRVGPEGLGLLRSAPAIGAVFLGSLLGRMPIQRNAGVVMFAAVAIFGIATTVFGLSGNFFLSMAALAVLGASDMASVYVRGTVVQLATPDGMRGRVSAVNRLFIGASNELGEFESGVTASWFGTVPSVVIGGIGTLVVVVLGLCLFRASARSTTLPTLRLHKKAGRSSCPRERHPIPRHHREEWRYLKLALAKSQLTICQNASTYFSRALR